MTVVSWNMQGRKEVEAIRPVLERLGDKGILCLQEAGNLRITEGAGMKLWFSRDKDAAVAIPKSLLDS